MLWSFGSPNLCVPYALINAHWSWEIELQRGRPHQRCRNNREANTRVVGTHARGCNKTKPHGKHKDIVVILFWFFYLNLSTMFSLLSYSNVALIVFQLRGSSKNLVEFFYGPSIVIYCFNNFKWSKLSIVKIIRFSYWKTIVFHLCQVHSMENTKTTQT